ncbi:MoaD/ThiS family protein [Candidatus Harpocratesius sp.]
MDSKVDEKINEKVSVEVRVFANLRPLTKFKKRIYSVPKGITIRELLDEISQSILYNREFLEETIDFSTQPEQLKKYVKIILNGRILFTEFALTTQIEENPSVVAIFPPIGGG